MDEIEVMQSDEMRIEHDEVSHQVSSDLHFMVGTLESP